MRPHGPCGTWEVSGAPVDGGDDVRQELDDVAEIERDEPVEYQEDRRFFSSHVFLGLITRVECYSAEPPLLLLEPKSLSR